MIHVDSKLPHEYKQNAAGEMEMSCEDHRLFQDLPTV